MFRKLKGCFRAVNQTNSSMGVQCVAPDKCYMRHTALCKGCKNNIGEYEDKDFYEPREK